MIGGDIYMIQIKRKSTKKTALKAGIAGAVIGAAGAAIGMSMKDKKNRDKVKKTFSQAKKWTEDTVESMQGDLKNTAKSVKEKANEKPVQTKSATKKTPTSK